MATEHVMRASDSDREHTVEALRGQFAEGRLTLEEFDERTSAAYAAKTWTDLRKLTSDLPVRLGFGAASTSAAPGPVSGSPAAPGQVTPGSVASGAIAPGAIPAGSVAGRATWRFVPLIPIAFAAFVVASVSGWHHHRDGVFPFFPVIPLVIFGTIFALRLMATRHWRRR